MEEKNDEKYEWSDVVLTIGGKKIEGVAEMMYHVDEGDIDHVFPKLESISLSGNVKFSAKQMREFKKFLTGKKVSMPRKMKKRLKKEQQKRFKQWLLYYFDPAFIGGDYSVLSWTRGMSK